MTIRLGVRDKAWHGMLWVLELESRRNLDELNCRLHAVDDVMNVAHECDVASLALRQQM